MSQPAQPVITIAVSDALARIEAKVDSISNQLVTKADTTAVHELDTRTAAAMHELDARIRILENTQTSQEAVGQALTRARGAMWAGISAVAAAGGLVAYVISQVHH